MSLRTKILGLGTTLALLAGLSTTAVAGDEQPEKQPEAAEEEQEAETEREQRRAPAEASATVKAAAGVEKADPVDVAEAFEAGGEVFVWSRVRGAKDTTVRHVWKRDGSQIAEVELDVGSHSWRTWSKSGVSAGEYEVAVVAEDDSVLGQVAFRVE